MPLTDDATYRLAPPRELRLHPLIGEPILLSVRLIEAGPDRIDVTGEITYLEWLRVVDAGAFHVDLELGELPDESDRRVEVVLTLRTPFAWEFEDPDDVPGELLGSEPSPLHQTEAWLLASAMQEVDVPGEEGARARVGFRTPWARPLL